MPRLRDLGKGLADQQVGSRRLPSDLPSSTFTRVLVFSLKEYRQGDWRKPVQGPG
jgi:hypothetical protein